MNTQIVKLFGFILVLYALLFGFTSYWSVFDADNLEANTANKRPLLEEQQIDRGDILARDGSVIARSNPVGKGNDRTFVREYPEGEPLRQPDRLQLRPDAAGSASSSPTTTSWSATRPSSSRSSTSSKGRRRRADTVQSSLDPEAQRTAVEALEGQRGSVVAIVPSTGEVRAMVSVPGYDPNEVGELAGLPASQSGSGRAALQPRHPGRLPAGLDDEGGHRDRGARQRRIQPRRHRQRQVSKGDLRGPAGERRR